MTKTYIQGKDQALEVSISTMEQQLIKLGFNIEQVSWLNPVPNVWSVHIRDKHCPACFTNGKGSSKAAALASALGEFFERLACNYFFADFYLGDDVASAEFVHYPHEKWFPSTDPRPSGLMNEKLWQFYDTEGALTADMLTDLQSSNHERGICALPFERQSDKQLTYIPINIIGNLYVSNGMAAGNTPAEARTQALAECIERYVKNKIIAEAISLPVIPKAVIAQFTSIQQSIDSLEQQGFPITCFDASLGGEFPVICVTLFNPTNGGCFASFGAHPNFEVALERTVTELLQGRSLTSLDCFPAPSFDNDEVADHTNLETHFIDSSGIVSWDLFNEQDDFEFCDWNFDGSTAEQCQYLINKFHQLGADVYIADYPHLGTYACRILIPEFSEIYHQQDLITENNNRAQDLRIMLQNWLSQPDNDDLTQSILDQLENLNVDEFYPVDQLIGISFDDNSPWATLRVGELNAILYLAIGDHFAALDWAQWTLDFNHNAIEPNQQRRLRFYHIVKDLLLLNEEQIDFNVYSTSYRQMFGNELVDLALAHINNTAQGYDLIKQADLIKSDKHQDLLIAYNKLQTAKANFKNW